MFISCVKLFIKNLEYKIYTVLLKLTDNSILLSNFKTYQPHVSLSPGYLTPCAPEITRFTFDPHIWVPLVHKNTRSTENDPQYALLKTEIVYI